MGQTAALGRAAGAREKASTKRVTYGFITRLLGRSAGAAVTVVALHEATRYFGSRGWGPIAAAMAWVGIFVAIGAPGVTTYIVREIGRRRLDRAAVLRGGIRAVAIVSLVSAAAALLFGAGIFATRPHTLFLVAALVLWVPFMAFFQLGGSLLAASGRSDLRGVLDVVSSLLLLGATLVVVEGHFSQEGYVALFSGSVAASALLVAPALGRRAARGAVERPVPRLSAFFRSAVPLGQVDLFSAVYSRADSLMLFFIRGETAIAVYAVAYQVATFVMSSPAFITGAVLKDFMAANQPGRRRLAAHALRIAFAVAVPIPFFAAVFARPFVAWLSGPSFSGAGSVLVVLSVAAAISLVGGVLYQLAIYAGAEGRLWRPIAIVTLVNLGSNALAVPFFGANGAAAAMVLSEVVALVLYRRMFSSVLALRPSAFSLVPPLASVALVASGWAAAHWAAGVGAGVGVLMLPRAAVLGACYLVCLQALGTARRRRSLAQRLAGSERT